MENQKFVKVLEYIADSVETGYSSVFTFAVKELLTAQERTEFAGYLRNLTYTQSLTKDFDSQRDFVPKMYK